MSAVFHQNLLGLFYTLAYSFHAVIVHENMTNNNVSLGDSNSQNIQQYTHFIKHELKRRRYSYLIFFSIHTNEMKFLTLKCLQQLQIRFGKRFLLTPPQMIFKRQLLVRANKGLATLFFRSVQLEISDFLIILIH